MSLQSTRNTWERLGETDPLWAVLSTPGTRDGAWDLPWFLETGRIDLDGVLRAMSGPGVDFGRRVLDFGCGVGRLTQVLAEHVDEAVGVDLAESMIGLAHELLARADSPVADRVRFVHDDSGRLPFPDDSFDSALSLMVLQHLPPRLALPAILELHRVVRPGGVLALQIPSHPLIPEALPAAACRAEITVLSAPASLAAGSAGTLRAAVRNTGTESWPSGRSVRLANHWLRGAEVTVADDGRAELPHAVRPGDTVELELRFTAPDQPGAHIVELDVVQEFVAWWADLGSRTTRIDLDVTRPGSAPDPEVEPDDNRDNAAPADAATAQENRTTATEPAHSSDSTAAQAAPSTAAQETHADTQPSAGGPAVRDAAIEMHPLTTGFLRGLFETLGADVLAVAGDTLAGPGWASFTYVVRVR